MITFVYKEKGLSNPFRFIYASLIMDMGTYYVGIKCLIQRKLYILYPLRWQSKLTPEPMNFVPKEAKEIR